VVYGPIMQAFGLVGPTMFPVLPIFMYMIRLKPILKEVLQSADTYMVHSNIAAANNAVRDFMETHGDEVMRLLSADDLNAIYQLAYAQYPKMDQARLIQALNNALVDITCQEPTVEYPDPTDRFEIDDTSSTWEVRHEVGKWVYTHRHDLMRLVDTDDYREYHRLAREAFPMAQEWKLMLALHDASIEHDIHYAYITD